MNYFPKTTTLLLMLFRSCRAFSLQQLKHYHYPKQQCCNIIQPMHHRYYATTTTTSTAATASSGSSSNEMYEQRNVVLQHASTLQLAPMMEYTDRHFRHLIRLLSKNTLLYTEMVAANAVAHERQQHQTHYRQLYPTASEQQVIEQYNVDYIASRFLAQGTSYEGPSVLQLGGSDPNVLYQATRATCELASRGTTTTNNDKNTYPCNYTAFNLNCGCPSPKVAGKGCFGAALMDDPQLVQELCHAMYEGGQKEYPITVKCRIGTDTHRPWNRQSKTDDNNDNDEALYQDLCHFIETVAAGGIVQDFTIHARIAVLTKSFSPADNRKIPPLKYHLIQRLIQDFPHLRFNLNGGIESIPQVQEQLERIPGLQGVMVGRAFCADPWRFSMTDALLYPPSTTTSSNSNSNTESFVVPPHRWHVLEEFGKYADEQEEQYDPIYVRRFMMKAITGLFAGEPNAKRYRIALDEIAGMPKKQGMTTSSSTPISELILNAATKHLSDETLYRSPYESYERQLHSNELLRDWQLERRSQSEGIVQ